MLNDRGLVRPTMHGKAMNRYRYANYHREYEKKLISIEELIGSLKHTESLLCEAIKAEEERANVRDIRDPTYPTEARLMVGSLHNIKVTIARLRAQRIAAKTKDKRPHPGEKQKPAESVVDRLTRRGLG